MLSVKSAQYNRSTTVPGPASTYQNYQKRYDAFFNNPLSEPINHAEQAASKLNSVKTNPNRGKCAVCGMDVLQGQGVIDEQGRAGKGMNALLCYNDASKIGMVNYRQRPRSNQPSRRLAQFARPTIKNIKNKEDKSEENVPGGKKPGLIDSFLAGYKRPDIPYDEWKKRYWKRGRPLPRRNWFTRWLRPNGR